MLNANASLGGFERYYHKPCYAIFKRLQICVRTIIVVYNNMRFMSAIRCTINMAAVLGLTYSALPISRGHFSLTTHARHP